MKSMSLFLIWRTSHAALQPAESRGFLRHPAWPGLSVIRRNGRGGAKFVLKSFVHAARKPEIGSFNRWGSYDRCPWSFQGTTASYSAEMMNKVVRGCLFHPMDKVRKIEECRPKNNH